MQMDGYSTHQALIVAAIARTSGMVVEVGGGWYSTPLVNALATMQKRQAITVETSDYVYQHLKFLDSQYHSVQLLPGFNYDDNGRWIKDGKSLDEFAQDHHRYLSDLCESLGISSNNRLSVAFVDHKPSYLRHQAIAFFADKADYVIAHDSEHVEHYRYEPTFSSFRYRFDFILHRPNSVILSNYLPCDDFAFLQPVDKLEWKRGLSVWRKKAKAISAEREAKALEAEQRKTASNLTKDPIS